jgi:hypothetical protein
MTNGIEFDDMNANTQFIRVFLMDKITQTLRDFGCGDFESSRFIQWFCEASRFWPEKKSQEEFDRYARERLSDKVGYTRRQHDAFNILDQYFGKEDLLAFEDIIAAIHFCSPQELVPHTVFRNEVTGDVIVDLPRQPKQKKDRLLKVDAALWPTLELIYPWERIDDTIVKSVRVGGVFREFDVVKLAFWFRYRHATKEERDTAIAFHSADTLDWTASNLYSRWREGLFAERRKTWILPENNQIIPTLAMKDMTPVEKELQDRGTLVGVGVPTATVLFTPKLGRQARELPFDAKTLEFFGEPN